MRETILMLVLVASIGAGRETLVDAAAQVKPALVSLFVEKLVKAPGPDAGEAPFTQTGGIGSGFVFDTLGHILTCNHVVEGYEELSVQFLDGTVCRSPDVKVVGRDLLTDLAVLRVTAPHRFAPARLGDSDSLEVGQTVMALGSPYGLEGSASAGIVSALSRWGLPKSSGPDFQAFIQTDALTVPGNSGGPLVDVRGRVVGVSSFAKTQRSQLTGIGFATPINLAREVALQIIRHGRVIRGWLGTSTQPVTEGLRLALGLDSRNGALVAQVLPGSPAAKAGLRAGDVVVEMDGRTVEDVRVFQNTLAGRAPGSTVRLGYVRSGERRQADVVLGSWPARTAEKKPLPAAANWLGIEVADIPAADREKYGLDVGLLVKAVGPGGAADAAGVKATDIILEMNGTPMRSLSDYAAARQSAQRSSRPVLLRVLRGPQAFFVAVEQ